MSKLMRVFKLNDCDWVVADNQEKAIEWYMNEMDMEKEDAIDESELRECDIDKEGMYIPIKNKAMIEKLEADGIYKKIVPGKRDTRSPHGFGSIYKRYGEWEIKVPFRRVLEDENIIEPCVIASREY